MDDLIIAETFCGARGWAMELRKAGIGIDSIGFELNEPACQTSLAAGHETIKADVEIYPLSRLGDVDGLIASPPCQDFSKTGSSHLGAHGERGRLVTQVLRWGVGLRPRWIACEQVPQALGIWQEFGRFLEDYGYSSWTGVLDAVHYGAPQRRQRAILMARLDGPCIPPKRTHREPVSMIDVLPNLDPEWSLQPGGLGYKELRRPPISVHEPCRTVAFGHDHHNWMWFKDEPGDGRQIEPWEAGVLQGFPKSYPWRGGLRASFLQIGNAIPVDLAAAVTSSFY